MTALSFREFGTCVAGTQLLQTLLADKPSSISQQSGRNLLAAISNVYALETFGAASGRQGLSGLAPYLLIAPLLAGATKYSLDRLTMSPASRFYRAVDAIHRKGDRFAQILNLVACIALLKMGAPLKGWVGIAVGIQIAALAFPFMQARLLPQVNGDQPIIPWDNPAVLHRLMTSQAKANCWNLLRFYETQLPKCCAIATAAIGLNALLVEDPKRFRGHDTDQFFKDLNKGDVEEKTTLLKRGLALQELASVLEFSPVKVTTHRAMTMSVAQIRNEILAALKNPRQCVLALYLRQAAGQGNGKGHWSPIAAYHEESDSYLLLDVSRFNYPPAWIKAELLIKAMKTETLFNKWSRGFLVLEKRSPAEAI